MNLDRTHLCFPGFNSYLSQNQNLQIIRQVHEKNTSLVILGLEIHFTNDPSIFGAAAAICFRIYFSGLEQRQASSQLRWNNSRNDLFH